MGMAATTYWTAEMVRQLPDDGNRYEVVHGELLVTPAPRLNHQLLVTRASLALGNDRSCSSPWIAAVKTSPASSRLAYASSSRCRRNQDPGGPPRG
jgi:hypothetical protein